MIPRDASVQAQDGAREREFYKYYEPFYNAVQDWEKDREDPLHRTSPPATPLVAFAQLATFRLNAQRCLISFFDREKQYTLAEATRTTSLQSSHPKCKPEELWIGADIFDRPATICEHTIMRAENRDQSEVEIDLVPDVRDNGLDKAFPKVPPDFCFYAGVPVISPLGYAIGTFSVFDSTPREGLTDEEKDFMRDIAKAVMAHLELTRAEEEHQRAGRMVVGLGNFVEGKAGLYDVYHAMVKNEGKPEEHVQQGKTDGEEAEERNQEGSGEMDRVEDSAAQHPTIPAGDEAEKFIKDVPKGNPDKVAAEEHMSKVTNTVSSLGMATKENKDHVDQSSTKGDLQAQLLSANVRSTFSRAANIITLAIDVQGAIYYDASVGTYGGLVDEIERGTQDDERSEASYNGNGDGEQPMEPQGDASLSESEANKQCAVLGYSTPKGTSLGGTHSSTSSTDHYSMTEKVLHSMLRRHPRGKIFNFDPGEQHVQTEASDPQQNLVHYAQQVHPPDPPTDDPAEEEDRRRKRQEDLDMLKKLFPGVRSIAFVPLWDSHRMRWFAGGFAWSTNPIRLLHMDSELSFLSAFGHSIMATVARLDSQMADKAKADLLSSISHELRSPLHGILGSCECLEDVKMDPFQEGVIRTIETCGRTLLDTVDHLLDFAKINNLGKAASKKPAERRKEAAGSGSPRQATDNMMNIDFDVDLSVITEEALETVFAGYDFMKNSATSQKSDLAYQDRSSTAGKKGRVSVVIDINKSEDASWHVRTEAGAWRRVVMNLCGNALKYTSEGFIQLKLEAQPSHTKGHRRSRIILTVTDSGKGMSKEYLETRLFTPFAQEDPLLPGTGLGLSIVRQIISGMGGDVSVTSATGQGTEIRVELIMAEAPHSLIPRKPSITSIVSDKIKQTKAGFLGDQNEKAAITNSNGHPITSRSKEDSQPRLLGTFIQLVKGWFDLDTIIAKSVQELKDVDVVFMTQKKAMQLTSAGADSIQDKLAAPVLILCENVTSAQQIFAKRDLDRVADNVDFIPQPWGPRRLARALATSMERHKSSGPSQSTPKNMSEQTLDLERASSRGPDPDSDDHAIERKRSSETVSPIKRRRETSEADPQRNNSNEDAAVAGAESAQSIIEGEASVDSPRPRKKTTAPETNGKSKSGGRKLHVLIVDDNQVNRQLLERYLSTRKHDFMTAGDGIEAVDTYTSVMSEAKLGKSPAAEPTDDPPPSSAEDMIMSPPAIPTARKAFDFVLMDVSMPRMDGLEATRRIRAFERANGLPSTTVIALTGLASAAAQQEAFTSGVDLFLTKPVRLKELSKLLEEKGSEAKDEK